MTTDEALKQILRPHRSDAKGNEVHITWADLKTFCNGLSDDQLKQSVIYIGEEKGGGVYAIGETQDNMINPSGENIEAKSEYDEGEFSEEYKDEEVVLPLGSLYLCI